MQRDTKSVDATVGGVAADNLDVYVDIATTSSRYGFGL